MLERITEFLHSNNRKLRVGPSASSGQPPWILPGSFNPLHAGHLRMASYAAIHAGVAVEFEISVTNVDKPSLTADHIQWRLEQFGPEQTVWLTKSPTFVDKAREFPGATFLLGADTVERLMDPKYYENTQELSAAIEHLSDAGCRFLAFGRCDEDQFVRPQDLPIPQKLLQMMDFVPESHFRCDISSTALRNANNSSNEAE